MVGSLIAVNDSLGTSDGAKPDGRYFRLFSPLNFYHSVSRGKLGLDVHDEDTLVGNALLNVYLKKPGLVRYSDNELLQNVEEGKTSDGTKAKPRYVNMKSQVVRIEPGKEELDEFKKKPIDMFVAKPNFWKFSGDYYLQFLPNYISPNW